MRRRLLDLLTAALATLLGAVVIEAVFAAVNHWAPAATSTAGGPQSEMVRFTRYHPLLGWDGVPKRSGVFRHKHVTQNSLGNRSPEVSFEKPPGVRRVLVLGDSQAWGYGVADDETIAARLQALLDHGAERWQVVNLGVSGYGTDQEYLKYLLQGMRYRPDVVVTVVFKNDVLENAETVFWGVEKPRFFFDGERLCLGNVPPRKAPGWPEDQVAAEDEDGVRVLGVRVGLGWSETFHFFKGRAWRFSGAHRADPADLARLRRQVDCIENRDGYAGEGKALLAELLRRLDAIARSQGGRTLVVFVPKPGEYLGRGSPAYYDDVKPGFEQAGLRYLDLRQYAYAARISAAELFGKGDPHLSAKGCALAARAIQEAMDGRP